MINIKKIIAKQENENTKQIMLASSRKFIVNNLIEEEKEDKGLLNAINKGKTGKYVDIDNFLKTLQK